MLDIRKLFFAALVPSLLATSVFAEQTAKTFGGVGLRVSQILDTTKPNSQGGLVVIKVLDDTPAKLAGIEKGDLIVKVDGNDIRGLPISDIVGRIRGNSGQKVALTLVEEDGSEFSQELTRIELPETVLCPR